MNSLGSDSRGSVMTQSEILLSEYQADQDGLLAFFTQAWEFTAEHHNGYLQELAALSLDAITPERFLAEYTWVIMASGFNASVVYSRFQSISSTLSQFDPEKVQSGIVSKGCKIINNKPKWTAILLCARLMASLGWAQFREKYLASVETMAELPRIGPTVKYHLARNLGYDVVKPDLHLVRAADHFGMDPYSMCASILGATSDWNRGPVRIGQVDYAIWCYLGHAGQPRECCLNLNILSIR